MPEFEGGLDGCLPMGRVFVQSWVDPRWKVVSIHSGVPSVADSRFFGSYFIFRLRIKSLLRVGLNSFPQLGVKSLFHLDVMSLFLLVVKLLTQI